MITTIANQPKWVSYPYPLGSLIKDIENWELKHGGRNQSSKRSRIGRK